MIEEQGPFGIEQLRQWADTYAKSLLVRWLSDAEDGLKGKNESKRSKVTVLKEMINNGVLLVTTENKGNVMLNWGFLRDEQERIIIPFLNIDGRLVFGESQGNYPGANPLEVKAAVEQARKAVVGSVHDALKYFQDNLDRAKRQGWEVVTVERWKEIQDKHH